MEWDEHILLLLTPPTAINPSSAPPLAPLNVPPHTRPPTLNTPPRPPLAPPATPAQRASWPACKHGNPGGRLMLPR